MVARGDVGPLALTVAARTAGVACNGANSAADADDGPNAEPPPPTADMAPGGIVTRGDTWPRSPRGDVDCHDG